MTRSTQAANSVPATKRERIDALLDEALMESFPASDSIAISSGVAVIKEEHRNRDATDQQPD